jgi:hypothetical protein
MIHAVHLVVVERGPALGRLEVLDVDVGQGHVIGLEQLDQQPVYVRALVEGDRPALEVGEGLEPAARLDQHGLALR